MGCKWGKNLTYWISSVAIKKFTHSTFSNYIFWTGKFSILAKTLPAVQSKMLVWILTPIFNKNSSVKSANGTHYPFIIAIFHFSDSNVVASFSKRTANSCACAKWNRLQQLTDMHTRTKHECTCLHAAPACLRHCQLEENRSIVFEFTSSYWSLYSNLNLSIETWYEVNLFRSLFSVVKGRPLFWDDQSLRRISDSSFKQW